MKTIRNFTIAFAILFCAGNIPATIINVPTDQPTIQQGINASSDGDTVLVQVGTYVENIDFSGKAILVTSNYIFDSDSLTIEQTIIDGDSVGTVVIFSSGEGPTSILANMSITNGYGTGGAGDGGGVTCRGTAPTIFNCNIYSNYVIDGYGAGIHAFGANPTIIRNRIYDNLAVDVDVSFASGGGIWAREGAPKVIGNKIYNNFAGSRAGGVGGSDSLYIVGNEIYGNTSDWTGGGIQTNSSYAYIANNLIYDNESSEGGGMFFQGYSSTPPTPVSYNNIIYGNTANSGGGIYCNYLTDGVIVNSIVLSNIGGNIFEQLPGNLTVTYSNVEGGYTGEGNIDANPFFRDVENRDFHLMSLSCGDSVDSPCIDFGDPSVLDSLLDCSWGLGETRSDMGAYGGAYTPPSGVADDANSLPINFDLSQNYPNPFNASTTIKYNLSKMSHVSLEIYDILGRIVEAVEIGVKEAGQHQITWNADNQPSGIYFYRLNVDDFAVTKEMMLLK